MAFMTGFSTFMLILMVASLPFAQSSRALGFQAETTMTKQNKVTQTQGIEMKKVVIFESHGDSVVVKIEDIEESARQVPTGPDPLHHNQSPFTP